MRRGRATDADSGRFKMTHAKYFGSDIVAKAPPDGYTLLLSPGSLATNPASYKKMPYDAIRDFAPITQTHLVPNLFVIHPSLPVKSVKAFIALARAQPGEIFIARVSPLP
jgi:tripartite-type tricarboxylate transporter receptor subunit TctC